MTVRIGILGYGNLGRGIECAVRETEDMELCAVFTRRDPSSITLKTENVPVVSVSDILDWKDRIDVLVLCGGSATDLPVQTPEYAKYFNVIDSFDTHANIPQHFDAVDASAKESGHTAMISVGWDPGMFSLIRAYSSAILPNGKDYTFWGKGVSQGHSDAIRRIEGVADAKQYTIPVDAALEAVRNGENPELSTRQKHTRECFVVLKEGADAAKVEKEIVEMPNYFSDYDTTVHFISMEELKRDHSELAHGGFVFGSETAAGMRRMVVRHNTFSGTDVGLRFKSSLDRGGRSEKIFISDIMMNDIASEAITFQCDYVDRHAGSSDGDPVYTEAEKKWAPNFQDIHISNIVCRGCKTGIKASGIAGLNCVHDISIKDCSIIYNKTDKQIDEKTAQLQLSNVRLIPNKAQ